VKNDNTIIIVLALLGGAYLLFRSDSAAAAGFWQQDNNANQNPFVDPVNANSGSDYGSDIYAGTGYTQWPDYGAGSGAGNVDNSGMSLARKYDALKYAIRMRESGGRYNIYVGNPPTYFSNFADHPVNTGEKQKVMLRDFDPIRYANSNNWTTAAGAYQITVSTWNAIRAGLPDFSPQSQEIAADRLLSRIRGLDAALDSDDIATVLRIISPVWESMNPASYNKTLALYQGYLSTHGA
jgi:muramidase (phage lysozyme)